MTPTVRVSATAETVYGSTTTFIADPHFAHLCWQAIVAGIWFSGHC